jgi:hypothetical protein
VICQEQNPICEECGGEFCYCVQPIELEDDLVCGDDECTGFACDSSADCVAEFGAGAVCQAPDTGCCGQECVVPCDSGFCLAGAADGQRRRDRGRANTGRRNSR